MSDEDGAISSGGATCAPVPPRAQTQSISGLFLRVDPSCPLCVYVLRASEELSGTARDNGSSVAYYNPFLVPCKGANRSQALAKVVKAQTGQSATSLIEGRGGGAFEVITVPLPGSATAFNVFVVQIGPLNATHNSLTLATLEFSEHQKRMRALYDACGPARRVDTDLITALAVDKLASVPVVNLIAAADAVLKGARKVEILDYHDAVIPMRAEFLGALPLLRGALVKALTRFTAPAARGADARSIPESLGSPRVPVPQDMDTIGSFRHPRKGTELVISVGNFHAAHNLASLRAAGVTHIVNCFVSDLSPGHEFGLDGRALKCCAADPARNVGETCKPRHWTPFPDEFEYACVYAEETASACQAIESSWPAAFALVRDAWRSRASTHVLFHCMAGVNRSVTTASVFMTLHGIDATVDDALRRIRGKRYVFNNDGSTPGPYPFWIENHARPFIAKQRAKDTYADFRR